MGTTEEKIHDYMVSFLPAQPKKKRGLGLKQRCGRLETFHMQFELPNFRVRIV